MSILLYKSIKFPKLEYDQRVFYVKNLFQYFEYGGFWHNLESLWFLSLT